MRPRLSRRDRVATLLLLAAVGLCSTASAQGGLTTEGAQFLLIPIGARSLGMGQAVVADEAGSESVWWNPAGLARAETREVAVHHFQSYVGTGDVLSLVIPSSRLGVLTGSVYILNFGAQDINDRGNLSTGTLLPRNLVYAATYSTTVGSRVNAGITFKVVQLRVDCSGSCGVPTVSASTSALDAGAQYDVPGAPISLGVGVRNVGPSFQVNDREQADPLPTRIQLGVLYHGSALSHYVRGADIRLESDLIGNDRFDGPAARVGADLGYRRIFHLRGGYVFESSQASGPSLGLGLSAGSLFIDIARLFESFSEATGQPPAYISLRYLF